MSTDPPEQPAFQIDGPETGEASEHLSADNLVQGPSPIDYMNAMVRGKPIADNDGVTPSATGSGVVLFGRAFSYEALVGYGAIVIVIIGVIALVIGPGS